MLETAAPAILLDFRPPIHYLKQASHLATRVDLVSDSKRALNGVSQSSLKMLANQFAGLMRNPRQLPDSGSRRTPSGLGEKR